MPYKRMTMDERREEIMWYYLIKNTHFLDKPDIIDEKHYNNFKKFAFGNEDKFIDLCSEEDNERVRTWGKVIGLKIKRNNVKLN